MPTWFPQRLYAKICANTISPTLICQNLHGHCVACYIQQASDLMYVLYIGTHRALKVLFVWLGRSETIEKQFSRSLSFAFIPNFSRTYFEWEIGSQVFLWLTQTSSTLIMIQCMCSMLEGIMHLAMIKWLCKHFWCIHTKRLTNLQVVKLKHEATASISHEQKTPSAPCANCRCDANGPNNGQNTADGGTAKQSIVAMYWEGRTLVIV